MLLLLVGPLLFLLLLVSYRSLFSRKPKLPPSPFKLPIIGNLHQLGPLRHRSLLSLSQKHGPLMLIHMGQVPNLIVSSADAAEEVLKTHDLAFASRPLSKATSVLTYGPRNVSFSPYGEHWRQAKKVAIVHLLNPKRVKSFRSVREEETARLVERISSCAGEPVDLSGILQSYSDAVMSQAAAGRVAREEGKEALFRHIDEDEGRLFGGFQVFDMYPSMGWLSALLGLDSKLDAMARRRDAVLSRVLEDHAGRPVKAGTGDEDFVDVLLSLAREETGDFILTQNDVKAIVIDMIAAGTDTSYVVLDWSMAELVRNPTVMKKAQDEVRSVCNEKPTVGEDDVNQMIYLKAVVKEALRLHTPAPLLVPRESMKNTLIQGYEIPAKTRVLINAWAIARDPISWNDPEEFHPERFLDSTVDFKGHDFQFIPFGAGRRICPGIHFAITTIEFALANLLYHFDWTLPGGMRGEDLDMAEAQGLTAPRKTSLQLIATRHLS